jgi:hypothetical protein
MNEQPTTYHDNFGRAFYYLEGRRVYVDEKDGAQKASAPLQPAFQSREGPTPPALAPPPFRKGDLVEQWRHTDDGTNFIAGSDPGKKGTIWKVLEITDDYIHMELVSGKYEWGFDGEEYKYPGYTAKYQSSNNYRAANSACKGNHQILMEWRLSQKQERDVQPPSSVPARRSTSENSHSSEFMNDESTELASLLKESAHPGLYHRNGFRVLELPVEASVRDLTKRRQIVEAAAANGLPLPAGPSRVLPLNPRPDAFATREAVQRLTDPERRLVDEFFWFWAHQAGLSREDAALRQLCQDNADAAEQIWRKQEREQSQTLVSTHNLAVLHHVRALEYSERHLEGRNGTDAGETKYEPATERAQWEEAYRRWVVLLREEGFWSRLTGRIRELDDPRLTTGTARRIRAGLPLALVIINAQLALKAAEKDKFELAKSHVAIMRASSFSQSSCDTALNLATEPIRTRLKGLSKTAAKAAADNPEKANDTCGRLLEQTKPLLAIIDCLLPENHPSRGAVHDDVAIAALDCCVAFGNKTKKWKGCLSLCEAMMSIPVSQSAKERLKGNFETIKGNVEYALCWFCKENSGQDKAEIEVKMHGDVQRIPIPGGVRKTWRHITVKVPRCASCKSAHSRQITSKVVGALVGGLLGLPGCIYTMNYNDNSPALLLFPILAVVGLVVGHFVGKSKFSKGVGAVSTKKQHPRIKELLAEGWTWGENPTQ